MGGRFPSVMVPEEVDVREEPLGSSIVIGMWCLLTVWRYWRCDSGRYMPVAPLSDI